MTIFVPSVAKTPREVVLWIVANDFHEGWISHRGGERGLALRGDECEMFIPNSVPTVGLFKPSDFDLTRKMYEPSLAGVALLASGTDRPLLGYQVADEAGNNIQGDHNDPSGLASFEIMPPNLALNTIEHMPGFTLYPIFEGDIEEPVLLPETVRPAPSDSPSP